METRFGASPRFIVEMRKSLLIKLTFDARETAEMSAVTSQSVIGADCGIEGELILFAILSGEITQ